jgi:nucleotide-binding universal stress UspA family protein
MFKNILVPFDGSAMSRRAAARAVRLAREQKGRVTAIWIGPPWEPNLYAYDKDVPPGFISPRQHWANVQKVGRRRLAFVKAAAAVPVPVRPGGLPVRRNRQGREEPSLRSDRHGVSWPAWHLASAARQRDKQRAGSQPGAGAGLPLGQGRARGARHRLQQDNS